MKKKTVLLLTHSKDFYTIDRVCGAVSEKGYRPFRFNTDEFPQKTKLSIHMNRDNTGLSLLDENGKELVNTNEICSVWLRKIGYPRIDESMEPLLRNGCLSESKETLDIFLNELDHLKWIDHVSSVYKAGNKFYQLRLAHAAGIKTPKTIITNNPKDVVDFYHQMNGNIITKMLTPLTTSMSGHTPFVHTNRVREEDLEDLESLRYSPMVFQENIEKEYELRIVYVDGELFIGAIDSKATVGGETDWRTSKPGKIIWKHLQVPEVFADKLRRFMNSIGLSFGALDVIREPGGEFVFLEVNPTGEWGMIERDLDLPISKAIAGALTK